MQIIISHGSVQKPDTIDVGAGFKVVFGNFEETVASYPKDNTMLMTVTGPEGTAGLEGIAETTTIHVKCKGPNGPIHVKPWTTFWTHYQYALLVDRSYELWINETAVLTIEAAYPAKIIGLNIHRDVI